MADQEPSQIEIADHTLTYFIGRLLKGHHMSRRQFEQLCKPYATVKWINHSYEFILVVSGDYQNNAKFQKFLHQVVDVSLQYKFQMRDLARFTRFFLTLLPNRLNWHFYDEVIEHNQIQSVCLFGLNYQQVQMDQSGTVGMFFLTPSEQDAVLHLLKRCIALHNLD